MRLKPGLSVDKIDTIAKALASAIGNNDVKGDIFNLNDRLKQIESIVTTLHFLCCFDSSGNDFVFFQFTSFDDCKHSRADQRHCNSPFPWFGSNRHYPYFRLGSIHTGDRIIVPREHSRLHSGMDNFEPARFGDASSSQWIFSIRGSHVDHRISVVVWCFVCGVPSEVLRPAVYSKAIARLTKYTYTSISVGESDLFLRCILRIYVRVVWASWYGTSDIKCIWN